MQTIELTMTATESALSLALPHYQLMQRMQAAVEGNIQIEGMCIQADRLPLGAALLGSYDQIETLSQGLIGQLVAVTDVRICFIEGDPGLVGEPGREINSEGEIQVPANTKLRLEGTVTLLDTIGIRLSADFFVKAGEPNVSFKFTLPEPPDGATPSLGPGTFLPDIPLVRALNVSAPTIILTTTNGAYDPVLDANVNTGINFYGSFVTQESGDRILDLIGGVLQVRALALHASASILDADPTNDKYVLEGAVQRDVTLVEGENFGLRFTRSDVAIEISGAPPEPTASLSNDVVVELAEGFLSDSPMTTTLVFTGGIKAQSESVSGFFTLNGTGRSAQGALSGEIQNTSEWVNPFGIPGITLRQLSLQMGLTYNSPWIDNIGLQGNLRLGAIDGSAAILVDINDPDQFVLAGSTDRITLLQILSSMRPETFIAYNALPDEFRLPAENIVNVAMEDVLLNIVPVPTSIGGVQFREAGITFQSRLNVWGWNANAFLNLDRFDGLTMRADMDALDFGASVLQVLGANGEDYPQLRFRLGPTVDSELHVSALVSMLGISQEVFIQANLEGLEFSIAGQLFNQFGAQLAVTTPGVTQLSDFQVSATMENDLLRYLKEEATEDIQQTAEMAMSRIDTAQAAVNRAQQSVNIFSRNLSNRRRQVTQERTAATQGVSNAQRSVTQAQARVNRLRQDIRSREAELSRQRGRQQCTSLPFVGRRCVPDPRALPRITQLGSEIAGLQVALRSAQGLLSVTQQTLRGARQAVTIVPVDADPQVVALTASLETATAGLTAAQSTLSGARTSLGILAPVSQFIREQGLERLIDVRSAQFEASLDVAANGAVAMAIDVVFMEQRHQVSLMFDFNSPMVSVQAFADLLLEL